MNDIERKARAIFGDTELWRTGHPLHHKMMLRHAAIAMEARQGPDRETGLDGAAATARASQEASPTLPPLNHPIKE